MEAITQLEETGCGFATVACIVEQSYDSVKTVANQLGIFAEDEKLYSGTDYIRILLNHYAVKTSTDVTDFESWQQLPNLALLAINYHFEKGTAFWHWVVFSRENGKAVVYDSAKHLSQHTRTDFDAINLKWFIEVNKA